MILVCSWPSSAVTRTSPSASVTSVRCSSRAARSPRVRLGEDPHRLEPTGQRPRLELITGQDKRIRGAGRRGMTHRPHPRRDHRHPRPAPRLDTAPGPRLRPRQRPVPGPHRHPPARPRHARSGPGSHGADVPALHPAGRLRVGRHRLPGQLRGPDGHPVPAPSPPRPGPPGHPVRIRSLVGQEPAGRADRPAGRPADRPLARR